MVLVTSANGNAGSRIIKELLKKGIEVKATDISPNTERLKDLGVKDVVVGHVGKKAVIEKALEGCDQLLYIPPGGSYTEAKMAKQAFDLASERGFRQVVMVSVTHPNMSTLLQHTTKLKAEEALIYKGLSDNLNYTILQPMHYTYNFPVKQVWDSNVYGCFYSIQKKLSYVDASDVGQICAKVLTEDGHQNATYELVGDDFLSAVDLVNIFNEMTGRNAKAMDLDVEAVLEQMQMQDSHFEEVVRQLAYTYSEYGITGNSNVLTWLLGRKPTTFKEYLKRELDDLGLA